MAPASIGNVGPGFDVLGLCVDGLADEVTVRLGDQTQLRVRGADADAVPLDPDANATIIAARAMLRALDIAAEPQIETERRLPLAGGLGSSAAAAVAGALGAAAAANRDVPLATVLSAALAGEAAAGSAHLDNIAPCLVGGLTVARSTEPPDIYRAPIGAPWWVAVVTPDVTVRTESARQLLPEQLSTAAWVNQMAHTSALLTAFALGDPDGLGRALHDAFAEPRRAPLVPGLAEAKAAARDAGALGASLSGSGPTVFAIAPDRATAKAVRDALCEAWGATRTAHIAPLDGDGAGWSVLS